MFARVARFEGGDPARADEVIGRVRQMLTSDPPPGLEAARRMMMLVDRENGVGLGVVLFDDEESLRRGHEALNAMTRPTAPEEGGGTRTSVELFEVAIDHDFGR